MIRKEETNNYRAEKNQDKIWIRSKFKGRTFQITTQQRCYIEFISAGSQR